jgi:LysR family glycine cleavage system transcriptional activator
MPPPFARHAGPFVGGARNLHLLSTDRYCAGPRERVMRENTIRGLRTFCVAARHLSFKAAAEELCITPSAVSHQIKGLETLFDLALFRRLTRGVALTEAGLALFAQVDPHLVELDEITTRFQVRGARRRILCITLFPFFASEILIPRLASFTEVHGTVDIRVETTEAGASHAEDSDASILLLSEAPSDVVAHPLFPLSLVPAGSPELVARLNPADPATWRDAALIVHKSRPTAWRDWFAEAGLELDEPPGAIYLDSMFSVARAAERGLGIALVPVPLIDGWFESRALVRVSNRALATSDRYFLVYRHEDAGNAEILAFRDWVESHVRDG